MIGIVTKSQDLIEILFLGHILSKICPNLRFRENNRSKTAKMADLRGRLFKITKK